MSIEKQPKVPKEETSEEKANPIIEKLKSMPEFDNLKKIISDFDTKEGSFTDFYSKKLTEATQEFIDAVDALEPELLEELESILEFKSLRWAINQIDITHKTKDIDDATKDLWLRMRRLIDKIEA